MVGEQPLLAPGESFQYTSACVLKTSRGQMYGTYQMLRAGGHLFDAVVAPLSLGRLSPRIEMFMQPARWKNSVALSMHGRAERMRASAPPH